jgi:ATP-dependent helicase HrpB
LTDDDPLALESCLAIADLDDRQREARIRRTAPLDRANLTDLFGDQITEDETIHWDTQSQSVRAERRQRLGALILKRSPLDLSPGDPRIVGALCQGIRKAGLDALPWTDAARQLRHRLAFAARYAPEADWPDVSDDALLSNLETWLAPFLAGVTDLAGLANVDMHAALSTLLDWPTRTRLDDLAPTHFPLPKGRKVKLDYATDPPVLATKLQDLFGVDIHPAVAAGRVPLSVHLLSPAGRPVQVTTDLSGFWRGSYRDVRKDMRGRYPKHKWPENPLENAD